jgi:phospholipid/cholesterol/gamma-HCH transport system substrate-binding protein
MKEQTINRAKLGFFVLGATTLLILGLYYIGSQKNIFHSTINVSANFKNVSGLMPGNNVCFNGINVGTVSKVYAVSDTAIKVEFTIDESSRKYIFKSSLASIGTDGLLGNKLINISPGAIGKSPIEEGDVLTVLNPIEMDYALRTLTITNDNLKVITDNLKHVTEKLNTNSIWNLLSDSILAENIKNAVVKFKVTSDNSAIVTGDLKQIVQDIKIGKGSMGALLMDNSFSDKLNQTVVSINALSDSVAIITGDFRMVSQRLKNGEGSVGTLLTDTTFVHNLNMSLKTVNLGAGNFNDNMEALKQTWPLKRYFKKQQKAKLK